jgi:hypothetical protein
MYKDATWVTIQGFELVIGFITLVITNNYDSYTELHAQDITVITAHIKSSKSSPAVAWRRATTADSFYLFMASATKFSQLVLSTYWTSGLIKLLLDFASTVISGLSPIEVHDQEYYALNY